MISEMKAVFLVMIALSVLGLSSCDTVYRSDESLYLRTDSLTFTEYKDFESAYKAAPDIRRLKENFDLFSVFLLDSSLADVFYKDDPKLREDVYYASLASNLCESRLGFIADSLLLKDVLKSKSILKRILNCTNEAEDMLFQHFKISSPVYIHGDTAIVKIQGRSTSAVYHMTLSERVVKFALLESVIED